MRGCLCTAAGAWLAAARVPAHAEIGFLSWRALASPRVARMRHACAAPAAPRSSVQLLRTPHLRSCATDERAYLELVQVLYLGDQVVLEVEYAQPRAQVAQELNPLNALLVQGHLLQRRQQPLVVLRTLRPHAHAYMGGVRICMTPAAAPRARGGRMAAGRQSSARAAVRARARAIVWRASLIMQHRAHHGFITKLTLRIIRSVIRPMLPLVWRDVRKIRS